MSLPFLHKSQLDKLKSFVNPVLLNRGYTLFSDKKVEFVYYNPADETYFFEV
ncbi:hypothetical protein [Cyclobacterium salsum]|uniref:hypothetical protein n=1 Tax=Cyclobacterium salsum TaxID=2666329 RepID=UPI0013907D27|nr:hypothetical protein [Cyclobacterium salsum]